MREPLPDQYKPLIIIALCSALVLLGISLYQTTRDRDEAAQAPETNRQVNPAAVASELSPEGFPLEFVIDEEVKQNKAYTLTYTGAARDQMTAWYTTKQTAEDSFTALKDILNAQLWTVLEENRSAFLASVYGVRGNQEVRIITEQIGTSTESTVIVSVVNKPVEE
jgi:hypothetical protein